MPTLTATHRSPRVSAHVASCVIRVSDLDRSLTFYRDVFSCRVAIREADMALLLAPNGFQVYLHSQRSFHRRGLGTLGVQVPDVGHRERVRSAADHPAATGLRHRRVLPHRKRGDIPGGVRPDKGRVIIAYPAPANFPAP